MTGNDEKERIRAAMSRLAPAVAETGVPLLAGLGPGGAQRILRDRRRETELADQLLGWTAPETVEAVIAVWGRQRGYGVARSGAEVKAGEDGRCSRLQDYARRSLNLATPQPAAPGGAAGAKLWLAGLLVVAGGRGDSQAQLGWRAALRLNPYRISPDDVELGLGGMTPASAACSISAGKAGMDWVSFRSFLSETLSGRLPAGSDKPAPRQPGWDLGNPPRMFGVSWAEAEWLDNGALSRQVAGFLPPVGQLMIRLGLPGALDGAALENVVAVVRILLAQRGDKW